MDKIQEELEKEIELLRDVRLEHRKKGEKGQTLERYNLEEIHEAKLAQHLATKQAMIKEFEKMIDERMKVCGEPAYAELLLIKQKLGELKWQTKSKKN